MFREGSFSWFKRDKTNEGEKTKKISSSGDGVNVDAHPLADVRAEMEPYKHTDKPVTFEKGDVISTLPGTGNPEDEMIAEEESEKDPYAEYNAQGDTRPIQEDESDMEDENISLSEQEKRIWKQHEDELNQEIVDDGGYLNFIKPEELKKLYISYFYNSLRSETEGILKKLIELSKKRKEEEEEKQDYKKVTDTNVFKTTSAQLKKERTITRHKDDWFDDRSSLTADKRNRGRKEKRKDIDRSVVIKGKQIGIEKEKKAV